MKRAIFLAICIILLGGIAFGVFHYFQPGRNTLPAQYYSQTTQGQASATKFDHVVIILEENKPASAIIGSSNAPYINRLIHTSASASNYSAITHPSLPNYLALTRGTTGGITTDCNPSGSCQITGTNLVDEIEQSGRSWKEYAESMPAPCTAANSGNYAVRHDPFMYFPDVTSNKSRCAAHVVPFTTLTADLQNKDSLPNYSFITPNLCNDMHDCSVSTGDTWLAQHVPTILHSAAFTQQHSLLIITWDEGDANDNTIPTIFSGSAAQTNYVSTARYDHYSLLHTIEDFWQLAPLTSNDKNAPLMTDMIR